MKPDKSILMLSVFAVLVVFVWSSLFWQSQGNRDNYPRVQPAKVDEVTSMDEPPKRVASPLLAPDPSPAQNSKPKRIESLLAIAHHRPGWTEIGPLLPEDLPLLKSLYRQDQTITNRMALMFALACIGDEEVVDMFQHSLFKDFQGRTLTFPESQVLKSTVMGLGILAANSDRAFDLLKQGTDFGFWRFRRTWQQEREYDGYPDWEFVDLSIQGLAISGHPEFPEILGALLSKKDAMYFSKMDGAVVTAVLQYKLAREYGRDELVKAILDDGTYAALVEWRKTPDGQSWEGWRAGVYHTKQEGIPLPVPPKVEPIRGAKL